MTFSKEQAEQVDYSSRRAVVDVLGDLIHYGVLGGESTEEINAKIAMLREAATRKGKKEDFDHCFFLALQGYADTLTDRGMHIRLTYTQDDFLSGETPYHEAMNIENAFLKAQRLKQLEQNAKAVGVHGFSKLYQDYEKAVRTVQRCSHAETSSVTAFPDAPLQLCSGSWICDEEGVRRFTSYCTTEEACCHPILPTRRLINIDTGEEKLEIGFYKGTRWRYAVYGKDVLFVASKIVQLATIGVAVTSENARALVKYLCEIENKNLDRLPQLHSTSRLGYVGDDGIFAPYQEDLIFDGDAGFQGLYQAIRQEGSFEAWRETAIRCRRQSRTAQVMLAASFASVLVGKLGALPFFVHLWGTESGTGKTVGLMLAASVWGDPSLGRYVQTFNATQVSHERTAGFLGNIPLCIDELQLSKDSFGKSRFDVYQLAQGVGRGRGNKMGSVDRTSTWALCILTTGESPIVQNGDGAGAVNRVLDIECKASDLVIADGMKVSAAVKENFGHAGARFVASLTQAQLEKAKMQYADGFRALCAGDTTEKQAMAAALILAADALADEVIFQTGEHLTPEEMAAFLQTKASVSAGARGYRYLCDFVSLNRNKFSLDSAVGETYGMLDGDWVYINVSVFRKAAADGGFDARSLLSWMKEKDVILTRERGGFTKNKRIGGVNTECVVMQLPTDAERANLTDVCDLL